MRILIVVHQFFPEFLGGTEVLTLDTAKMLQKKGHDVRILTAYPCEKTVEDIHRFDRYIYEGLEIERFKHSVTPMGTQNNTFELEYNNLFFADYFRKYLKNWAPDIVHFIHFHRMSASAIDVCYELKIPSVYTATDFWLVCPVSQLREYDNSTCNGPHRNAVNCVRHMVLAYQPEKIKAVFTKLPNWGLGLGILLIKLNLFPKMWFTSYVKALSNRPDFMKKRLNRIDKVLVPTKLMGQLLIKNGLHKSRVQLQHFGIDVGKYETTAVQRGKEKQLRIGFIGTLFEHKGIHLLIEAVKNLPPHIPVQLKIYGDTEQFPEYGKKLLDMAIGYKQIEFLGTFPNEQIGKILQNIDVLVVPSIWYENTPLVIYSALAAGCPVIATDLGGMSEVIQNNVNGLLFKKEDIPGLTGAIRRLAEDRDLLEKLSRNTKMPKSMETYVSELESYYQELIEKVAIK